MPNTPKEWEPIRRREMDSLEGYEEFQTARDLLITKELVVQTAEGPKHLRITQVEPFRRFAQPNHQKAFEEKKRAYGEFFIIWHRGHPLLNIVVDPESGSIVCIKSALLDGEEVTATRIIKELGLDKGNFSKDQRGTNAYRDAVGAVLDGKQALTRRLESPVRIEQLPKSEASAVVELRRHFGDRARNSLGLFGNCAKMPG